MKAQKICFECGATDYIKYFAGKQLCEKCLFFFDTDGSEEDDEDDDDD